MGGGGPRFRILGGARFRIWGGARRAIFPAGTCRNDVASTSFRRHVSTRFLINQCQIIHISHLKI